MWFTPFYTSLPLFARLFAFFALSPLFARREIPLLVRVALAALVGLLLSTVVPSTLSPTVLLLLRELAIGYLLGTLFSLLFEAASLAGVLVGSLGGFSATELLDPLANSDDPLISRLFVLTFLTLFLALDGHHLLLSFLQESFLLLPLNHEIPKEGLREIVLASALLFRHAVALALIPLIFLLGVIITFAMASRFLPHLPIFWIGFPLQLLLSWLAIASTLVLFPEQLGRLLSETIEWTKQALFSF